MEANGAEQSMHCRSSMGSGKSTLLQALMDEQFGDERVLIVTYRQTLAYNLDLKLKGFHNYLDGMEEMNDRERRPRVICQLDSILATCETSREVPKFDLVVLDEVASLIGHTAAPTLRAPVKVMSMFVRILQTAERVLTMDALWGGESHDFLTACGVEGRLVVNTQRSASRCFEMSADVDQWEAQIAEDLSEGKNIVLASMSSEAIYRVMDAVKSRHPGCRRHSSAHWEDRRRAEEGAATSGDVLAEALRGIQPDNRGKRVTGDRSEDVF